MMTPKIFKIRVLTSAPMKIVFSTLTVMALMLVSQNDFSFQGVNDQCEIENIILKNGDVFYNETTCGDRAFLEGSNQKVISYVYYDDEKSSMSETRKYFQGIELNSEINQKLYPEWKMWLYHDLDETSQKFSALDAIRMSHSNLELCNIKKNPMFGNAAILNPRFWRFLPLCDSQVDFAHFRDLDSVASEREVSAVSAWINSKHSFHVMRDHPGHDVPILAGMWGTKVEPIRQALRLTMMAILRDIGSYAPRNVTSNDQAILMKYFWPWAKDLTLQHDSYHCQDFAKSRPWPTQRPSGQINNFVGAPFALNSTLSEECPERCRPREHPEWTFC